MATRPVDGGIKGKAWWKAVDVNETGKGKVKLEERRDFKTTVKMFGTSGSLPSEDHTTPVKPKLEYQVTGYVLIFLIESRLTKPLRLLFL